MSNRDVARAREYHERTKHSPESVRHSAHFLDWANQPLPFKIYTTLEPVPAPPQIHKLLHYSVGITRRRKYPGGEILFRAAACTGALYEIELYLVCGPLEGLEAGVYHMGPADIALRRLRDGDHRALVAAATGQEPSVAQASAILVSTGTYWRNAWKYQARTYRHFGWDNGTIHANLLAVASAQGIEARLVLGFVDEEINRLLDLDTDREVALAMVALGRAESPAPASPAVAPLSLPTAPLSRHEVDYPLMREMHAASSLATPEEVAAWRDPAPAPAEPFAETESIEEVIQRRGSTRQFRHAPITETQLAAILERATRGVPADFGKSVNEVYTVVNFVDNLTPGAYYYDRERRSLECLKPGDFRRQAAFLALDQDLAGDASVAVFFLADLDRALQRFGNRGYRVAQLDAGILGGQLYLAAYAERLGATGLTFYDDEVVRFFSPHAAGKSAIFLVAVGHRA